MRLNAEDPRNNFAPAPGLVTRMRPPLGPGVRLDTHVEDGYLVPPFYDSLLGKLVVWDETRPQAIDRMLRALGELVLEGVPTTRELAIDVLRSEEFASGSPAATRSCSRTMSMPVTSSVTGCSTCRRAFSSMK